MTLTLEQLAAQIDPARTVLFLGAGASRASGAPTGSQLADFLWQELHYGEQPGSELSEIAGILEVRYGRQRLIQALRKRLGQLMPTEGMLYLPFFDWQDIFTTNYDQLVERAYGKANHRLRVVRSNADVGREPRDLCTTLWKLHGCITEDEVDGKNSRIIITERDYDLYEQYRESLFSRLKYSLYSSDLLFVGHSLRDRHIKDEITKVAQAKRQFGGPGKIRAILHESDCDYMLLVEQRGVEVAIGTLDAFLTHLGNKTPAERLTPLTVNDILPPALIPTVVDVSHARTLDPAPSVMAGGRPASFADIESGFSVRRTIARECAAFLSAEENFAVTITGPSGIGKTTAARQVALAFSGRGARAWQHKAGYPFYVDAWKAVANECLRRQEVCLLMIDDSLEHLQEINDLCRSLSRTGNRFLKLVLTAHGGIWDIRTKNAVLLKDGAVRRLVGLDGDEIGAMADLVLQRPEFLGLLDSGIRTASRDEIIYDLRIRCSNDMFVALKYLFSLRSLDEIILREFNDLSPPAQEVYKLVAGLQALGLPVHRQLVLRMRALSPERIAAVLQELDGMVFETEQERDPGIFEWSCRHQVIANTLTQYKYADGNDLYDLAITAVRLLNTSVLLERRAFNRILSQEYLTGRRISSDNRKKLLRETISIAPNERVPYHRLVGILLSENRSDEAEVVLERGIRETSLDPPFARYRIEVSLKKAEFLSGIGEDDRMALLLRALSDSETAIEQFADDKHAYRLYARCCLKVWEKDRPRGEGLLADAQHRLLQAYERLGEPSLKEMIDHIEARRSIDSMGWDL